MPRIPIYEQQGGLNQQIALRPGASGEDFGANIGRAIQGFGQQLKGVAVTMEQRKEDDAQAWANEQVSRSKLEWLQTYQERQVEAKDGAQGFTGNLLKEYQDYVDQTVSAAPTERSRNYLRQSLNNFGVDLGARALTWEDSERAAYRASLTVKDYDNRAKIVNMDPSQYEAERDEAAAGVSQRGLEPSKRQKMIEAGTRALAYSAGEGVVQKDAQGFLQMVAPESFDRRFPTSVARPATQTKFDAPKTNSRVESFAGAIDANAQKFGVDPNFMRAQLMAESAGRVDAVSSAGAMGIAQFMPGTAQRYGIDPKNPEQAINGQARYMADLLKMFDGDYTKAAAAYNWGEGNVQKAVKKHGDNWLANAPAETQGYVRKIFNNAPPGEFQPPIPQVTLDPVTVVAEAKKSPGAWWDDLPLDDQQKLVKQAQALTNQQLAAERGTLMQQRKDAHTSAYSTGEAPNMPTYGQYVRQFGEAEAERMFREDARVVDTGRFLRDVRGMSPAEQEAALGPKPGPGQDADAYKLYDDKLRALAAARDQRDKDPAAYTLQSSKVMQQAAEKMAQAQQSNDPDLAAAATKSYAAAMLSEQQRLGVRSPAILSDAQVNAITANLTAPSEGGENVATRIETLAKQYGDYYPMVYSQLAPKVGPMMRVIGAGMPSQAASVLAEANSLGEKELKKLVGDDKAKEVDDVLSRAMAPLTQTLAPLVGGGGRTESDYREQAKLLALSYMRSGASANDAVKQAFDDVVGAKYTFSGTYRVPKQFDAEIIERGAQKYLNTMSPSDFYPVLSGSTGVSNRQDVQEQIASAVKSFGYWVNESDDTLVLYRPGMGNRPGQAVRGSDGQPIRLRMADVMIDNAGVTNLNSQQALENRDMRAYERLRVEERRRETAQQNQTLFGRP